MNPPQNVAQYECTDQIFQLLRGLLPGLRETFGHRCEVVLHDFRDIEHSIVAIEGNLTGRQIGGSVSEIGLAIWAQEDSAHDRSHYLTRTAGGRTLRSSTLLLRRADGHVFGALCINSDVTEIQSLLGTLQDLVGHATPLPTEVRFSDDLQDVVRAIVQEEIQKVGRPVAELDKLERLRIFRRLDQRGVFHLQKAVPTVSRALGISRATAYLYLGEIRPSREVQIAGGDQLQLSVSDARL